MLDHVKGVLKTPAVSEKNKHKSKICMIISVFQFTPPTMHVLIFYKEFTV